MATAILLGLAAIATYIGYCVPMEIQEKKEFKKNDKALSKFIAMGLVFTVVFDILSIVKF